MCSLVVSTDGLGSFHYYFYPIWIFCMVECCYVFILYTRSHRTMYMSSAWTLVSSGFYCQVWCQTYIRHCSETAFCKNIQNRFGTYLHLHYSFLLHEGLRLTSKWGNLLLIVVLACCKGQCLQCTLYILNKW